MEQIGKQIILNALSGYIGALVWFNQTNEAKHLMGVYTITGLIIGVVIGLFSGFIENKSKEDETEENFPVEAVV